MIPWIISIKPKWKRKRKVNASISMKRKIKVIIGWASPVAFAIGFLLIFNIFFEFNTVVGNSMLPNFQPYDYVIINRHSEIKSGDVVSVYSNKLGEQLIKRIIGVSGDKIELLEDGCYVNGAKVNESYVNDFDWKKDIGLSVVVPEGCYFVMGDNRDHSTDSRYLGCFSEESINGVVVLNVSKLLHINAISTPAILLVLWGVVIIWVVVEELVKLLKRVKAEKGSS